MADAKTLYVNRPVLNAADIIAWAKEQGFATTLLPDDMHVTVAYSKEPFDWSGLTPDTLEIVASAGDRDIKAFGDGTVIVLAFENDALSSRWASFRDAGASWSWPEYRPHVTLTYQPGEADLASMTPYAGPIRLGPERFKEIDENWSAGVAEKLAKEQPQMNALSMFIPITKIDAAQRLVYGIATAEAPDRAKEVCDYASTKPYYEKWSGEIAKATDGKSLGNLRSMHGPIAAGKVTEINFNDDDKQIEICAKVVDDAEWNKVEQGVYTGFSQGGSYVKKWKDKETGLQRYTADPVEISLVDLPCLPDATFQMIKADGATELRKFTSVVAAPSITALGNRAEKLAKAAGRAPADWKEFADAAQLELMTEAVASAEAEALGKVLPGEQPAAEADPAAAAVETAAETDKAASGETVAPEKPARKWVEPKNIWACGCADHEHVTKAEAVRCMKEAEAAELAKAEASPAESALARLEAAVGVTPLAETADAADPVVDPVEKADAAGTAMPDGSFPIANKSQLKDAIQAFGRAKNKASAKRHIIRRAKALDATDLLPADWPGSTKPASKDAPTGDLEKAVSLYGISNLISILACIEDAEESFEMDSYWGGAINAPGDLKDRFGALLIEFGDIAAEALDLVLSSMDDEESTEAMTRFAPVGDIVKALAGAKTKIDPARLEKLFAAGSSADGENAEQSAESDLTKALDENKALKSTLATFETRLEAVTAQVEQMRKAPAPAKAALMAVGKGEDGGAGASQGDEASDFVKKLEGLPEAERARELLKLALRFPKAGHPDARRA